MKTVKISIVGTMPLLMHQDNVEWADHLKEWRLKPENKEKSTAGDDRTPPWTWVGSLYHNNEIVTVPTDNLWASFMGGAAMVRTGKGAKTFKAQSQSGMIARDFHWPLFIDGGNTIPMGPINNMVGNNLKFKDHVDRVTEMGFALDVKRIPVGMTKHVRVRPMFSNWRTEGEIIVTDEQLLENLKTILEYAGRYKGIMDFRPSSPRRPGPYGTYDVEIV